jgi:hypothetical protein
VQISATWETEVGSSQAKVRPRQKNKAMKNNKNQKAWEKDSNDRDLEKQA